MHLLRQQNPIQRPRNDYQSGCPLNMYTAQIRVNTKTDLEKIFQSEEKNINERARYTLTKDKNGHAFRIEAKDATALRAIVGSITKVLSVHEKTLEIIEKNK